MAGSMMDWLKKLWSRWFGKQQAEPPQEPDDPPELEDAPVDTPLDTGEDPVSIAQGALEVDEPDAPKPPDAPDVQETVRPTNLDTQMRLAQIEQQVAKSESVAQAESSEKKPEVPTVFDVPEPDSTKRDIDPGFDLLKQSGIEPSSAEDPGFDMTKSLGIEEPEAPYPIQELDVQDPPEIKPPQKQTNPPAPPAATPKMAETPDISRSGKNAPSGTLPISPLPQSPHTTPEFTSMAAAGLDVPEIRGTRPAPATSSTTPQNRPERQTVQSDTKPPEARQPQAEQATEAPEATIEPPPDPETFQPVEQPEVVFEELNQQQRREDTQTTRQQKQQDRRLAVTNQARQRKGMAPLPSETESADAEPDANVESGGSGEVVRILEAIRDLLEENREMAEKQVDAINSLKDSLKNVGTLA